ncbi:uncharacterized protein LOC126751335 [Bactrocera neohumeralis]|uniref:uncharacterized protein LOC120782160 n=1 Tax=Bactrocera tryoni TaxID=59916 RepID=UPI001A95AED5|nr:uncharacterized protein LOC120782160 [Bactrocera tryoni]XP_050317483.1 uncharacterized protein LOC126751335 [Bactrocera neohumeralis]
MPIMEDSGIDSEDKQSNSYEDSTVPILEKATTPTNTMTEAYDVVAVSHMADLEVVFRGSSGTTLGSSANAVVPEANTNKTIATKTVTSAALTAGESEDESTTTSNQPAPNTCRILQRKLELKVERARRNFSQHQQQQEQIRKSQSANLIPISRLPIPGDSEQKPLVDYKSDSSDEPEEISFFPAKLKNAQRQRKTELSDTFSIQEMTIESDVDSDDSGSQNLELLPPLRKTNFLESLKICFGCGSRRS